MEGKQFENKGNGEKDPWEMLPQDWRDDMWTLAPEAINANIAEQARLIVEKKFILKTDPEVLDLKEKLKKLTLLDRETINLASKRIELLNQENGWPLSESQIDAQIAEQAKLRVEKEDALKNSPQVVDLKEKLKERTFNDRQDIKFAKKKIEFLHHVLKESGKA